MFEQIKIQRMSMTTIYKLLAIGTTFSLVPFSVLMGVLSLFGAQTITWDGKHLIGYDGLIASPFIGLFLSAFITLFLGTLCTIGLWLYSLWRPLSLRVEPVDNLDIDRLIRESEEAMAGRE
ncbi:MAG: hypothetical protein GAK35_01439 [Herbaspirillum frisingense]|uniref:DUF3566 domain-containing protein n=1 Tax=Herbaspirillum frisingense TaxID=92645 RepID=A0A7V8FY10_9BURK|nr:MAG: hypothetical protein GAK35_01439 [Herbaspirillum frisingense]